MRNQLLLLTLFLTGTLLVAMAACEQSNDAVSPEATASPGSAETVIAGDDDALTPESTASVDSSPTVAAGGQTAEFGTIEKGGRSGASEEETQLLKIETDADWEEFWARHRANVVPPPPLPSVDFAREMVIAVVDQLQPSGGYRLDITAIEIDGGTLVVRVSTEIPGPDCVVVAVTTRPFHIVRLAQSDLEPQLQTDKTTDLCQ